MAKVYFFKEIASNAYLVSGAPVQFEPLPGNRGSIALESPKDDTLIAALKDAATREVGGISSISESEYTEKKTLAASMPLTPPRHKEMLRPMPKGPFGRKVETAEAAEPVSRDGVPITDAAIRAANQANMTKAAMVAMSPSQTESVTDAAPPLSEEGFRPSTRRISRKLSGVTDSVPA